MVLDERSRPQSTKKPIKCNLNLFKENLIRDSNDLTICLGLRKILLVDVRQNGMDAKNNQNNHCLFN